MGADETPDRGSSFELTISLTVGYNRRRATIGGAFEGHLVTLGLLVGGIIFVALVAYALLHALRLLPF